MSHKAEELTGVVAETKSFPKDDPENPFIILELKDYTRVLGTAREDEFVRGMTYVFYGHWKKHSSYGRQFHFNSFILQRPADEGSVMTYLTRAPGMGAATARKIWKFYGADSIDAAKDEKILTTEFKLPVDRARKCAEWLTKEEKTQHTKLALTKLFAGHNLPRDLPRLCIAEWGAEAPAIIEENPFKLMMFRGVGFKKADAIWEKLGLPKADMRRGIECAVFAVKDGADGSTWYPRPQVYGQTRGHLGTEALEANSCIDEAVAKGRLAKRIVGDDVWCALASCAENEKSLSIRAIEIHTCYDDAFGIVDKRKIHWPDLNKLDITPHQREQLAIATSGPIGIFTGGPGTGKTYVLAQLVKAIGKAGSGGVEVSCPTGKAAVRSQQALADNGINWCQPKTMHSRLGFNGRGFDCGLENPIEAQFHILDEQSMVSADMLQYYFEAIRRGGHVLLTLDPHQLPPVGHGKPVLDLIQWGLPTGMLTETIRNQGMIVECCRAIRQEKKFICNDKLQQPEDNLVMTDSRSPEECLAMLDHWLDECRRLGFDLRTDVQVIAPMNEKGKLSVNNLNSWLQNKINGEAPDWKGWKIKVDDKVVCTQNGKHDGENYVANGEQGIVLEIREKSCLVAIPFPDRIVRFPINGPLTLAWCITCHKSQGSEWPVTLTMFDPAANRMGTAEWVTTAISRAKKFAVGIGTKATARKWVQQTGLFDRKTFLQDELTQFNLFQAKESQRGSNPKSRKSA